MAVGACIATFAVGVCESHEVVPLESSGLIFPQLLSLSMLWDRTNSKMSLCQTRRLSPRRHPALLKMARDENGLVRKSRESMRSVNVLSKVQTGSIAGVWLSRTTEESALAHHKLHNL